MQGAGEGADEVAEEGDEESEADAPDAADVEPYGGLSISEEATNENRCQSDGRQAGPGNRVILPDGAPVELLLLRNLVEHLL